MYVEKVISWLSGGNSLIEQNGAYISERYLKGVEVGLTRSRGGVDQE
jgi:hypothetical protein